MSTYQTLQSKGIRLIHERQFHDVIQCPAGYKYYSCVGMYMDSAHWPTLLAYLGGAANPALVDAEDTVSYVDKGIMTNVVDTGGTVVTPFSIKKGKFHVTFRNNGDKVIFATFLVVKPKSAIPTASNDVEDAQTSGVGFMFSNICNGIADKVSKAALNTSMVCNMHDVAPAGAKPILIRGVAVPELSLMPPLTIYDSSLFGTHFTVIEQKTIALKPGDRGNWYVDIPASMFLDGAQPYLSAETLAYEFTRYLIIGLLGDLGHLATALETPAVTVNNALSGTKQGSNDVTYSNGQLDVITHLELDIEVYDSELIEPMTGMLVDTAADRDDMADVVTQVVHDLN